MSDELTRWNEAITIVHDLQSHPWADENPATANIVGAMENLMRLSARYWDSLPMGVYDAVNDLAEAILATTIPPTREPFSEWAVTVSPLHRPGMESVIVGRCVCGYVAPYAQGDGAPQRALHLVMQHVRAMHLHVPGAFDPIDVDAIIASLDEELFDSGEDPWGGANLAPGPNQRPTYGLTAAGDKLQVAVPWKVTQVTVNGKHWTRMCRPGHAPFVVVPLPSDHGDVHTFCIRHADATALTVDDYRYAFAVLTGYELGHIPREEIELFAEGDR